MNKQQLMMMNPSQTQSPTPLSNQSACANKLSESSNDFDQSSLIKKYQRLQQQYKMQQQNCLFKIESEIQKTYSFYVQMLNERRDYLLKEFYAIVQFVQSQQNLKGKQQQQPVLSACALVYEGDEEDEGPIGLL